MNKQKRVYYEHGRIPDMRLQTLMVAPPGFSKSFLMHQCFDVDIGILWTRTIETVFQGSCTEAGWVGTYSKDGGVTVKHPGLAEEFAKGIVAIDEFTAITNALQQQHSLTFEPHLNSSLYGGHVHKRLASGDINYDTNVTLIGGTQVTKFDISGGLGRRFTYIFWIPSPQEIKILCNAVWDGVNVSADKTALGEYRLKLEQFQRDIEGIETLTFSKELREFLSNRPHFEQQIFRKIALGYELFNMDSIPSSVEIGLDSRCARLLKESIEWRDDLLADAEASQVLQIMQMRGGVMDRRDLQAVLLRYSINWSQSSYIVEKLLSLRKIRYNKGGQLAVV